MDLHFLFEIIISILICEITKRKFEKYNRQPRALNGTTASTLGTKTIKRVQEPIYGNIKIEYFGIRFDNFHLRLHNNRPYACLTLVDPESFRLQGNGSTYIKVGNELRFYIRRSNPVSL